MLEYSWHNYEVGIVDLAVVIAHELCHAFTGYLTGSDRPRTPKGVTGGNMDAYTTDGEHGWAWEDGAIGGCSRFYVPRDQENSKNFMYQTGTPYLQIVQKDGTRLHYEFIDGFISSLAHFRKSP